MPLQLDIHEHYIGPMLPGESHSILPGRHDAHDQISEHAQLTPDVFSYDDFVIDDQNFCLRHSPTRWN
jgi:hypothetical protein